MFCYLSDTAMEIANETEDNGVPTDGWSSFQFLETEQNWDPFFHFELMKTCPIIVFPTN